MVEYKLDLQKSAPSLMVTLGFLLIWILLTLLGLLYMQEMIPDEGFQSVGIIIWALGMLQFTRFIPTPHLVLKEVEE